MTTRVGDSWGRIRGILRERFHFAQIKDIVGASGLRVERLSHLQQKASGGASKSQLLDGVDNLVVELGPEEKDSFVKACCEEMLHHKVDIKDDLLRLVPAVVSAARETGLTESSSASHSDYAYSNNPKVIEPKSGLVLKSVVVIDLVGYSAICKPLEQHLNQTAITSLNDQIQQFIDVGLKSVNATRASTLHNSRGDGAILYFDEPSKAVRCAVSIHNSTEIHNSARTEKTAKRLFRIGICTGEVHITQTTNGVNVAGMTISRAARLEPKAQPGGILIDESTFQGLLPDQKNGWGAQIVIEGKHGEHFESYSNLINQKGPEEALSFDEKPANTSLLDRPKPSSLVEEATRAPLSERKYYSSCADFFSDRFSASFPGMQNIVSWFSDREEIAMRLDRLLAQPLKIDDYSPIWWFRGLSTNSVNRFSRLSSRIWLLNNAELQIERVAAVDDSAYWRRFVYVEVSEVSPIGEIDQSEIAHRQKAWGFCPEELCLFRGRYLRREFFDDGAGEVDGRIVDFNGEAELRIRYLTRYNFLISGQDSSINNTAFDQRLEAVMNGLLLGSGTVEDIVQEVQKLPKQVRYFHGHSLSSD
jgi:class 3 adenylate cyclase